MRSASEPLRQSADPSSRNLNSSAGKRQVFSKDMVGKVARYSSLSEEFRPVHDPVSNVGLKNMVDRLYAPQTLKARTTKDLEERAAKTKTLSYNSIEDSHLSRFWTRQRTLKNARIERRKQLQEAYDAAENGEEAAALVLLEKLRPQSQATHRTSTRGSSRPSSRTQALPLLQGPRSSSHMSQRQGRPPRPGPRPVTKEEPAGVDISDDPFPQKRAKSTGSDRSTVHSSRASSRSTESDQTSSRSRTGSSASRLDSAYGSDYESPSPSPQKATAKRDEEDSNSHAKAQTEKETGQLIVVEQGDGQDDFVRSELSEEDEEEGRNTGGVAADPLKEVQQTIHRRDLTALWMLACPPPSYQAAVGGLSIDPKQFKLSWLAEGKAPNPNTSLFHIPAKIGSSHENHGNGEEPKNGGDQSQEESLENQALADPSVEDCSYKTPQNPADDDGTTEEQSAPYDAFDMMNMDGFQISSPRSIIVLLRNGVAVDDILPKPLIASYKEASIQGKPPIIAERRYAAREQARVLLVEKLRKDYSLVCSRISQSATIAALHAINPNRNRDFPTSNDHDVIDEASSKSNKLNKKLSFIGSTAIKRQMESNARLANERSKFEHYLERNMIMTMDRVKDANRRAKREEQKTQDRNKRSEEEAEKRRKRQEERNEKLERVRQEGEMLREARRRKILQDIETHEKNKAEQDEMRKFSRLVTQEETRIATEEKHKNMLRRERIKEYKKLLVVDQIRRKIGKCDANAETEEATRLKVKYESDQSALGVRTMLSEHRSKVLHYQRRTAL